MEQLQWFHIFKPFRIICVFYTAHSSSKSNNATQLRGISNEKDKIYVHYWQI